MADVKDVELRIRAVLDGKKSLTDTVEALKDLAKAQDDQIAAAKRGETTTKALQKSYDDLGKVFDSLLKKNADIEEFDRLARVFDEIKSKVDLARKAQLDYIAQLPTGVERTKAQSTELEKLAKKIKVTEDAQAKASKRVAEATSRLEAYGIAASEVRTAEAQIVTALGQVEVAINKQSEALKTADVDIATAKARTEQAAAAEEKLASAIAQATAAAVKGAAAQSKASDERIRAAAAESVTLTRALTEQIALQEKLRDATLRAAVAAGERAREAIQAKLIAERRSAAEQLELQQRLQEATLRAAITASARNQEIIREKLLAERAAAAEQIALQDAIRKAADAASARKLEITGRARPDAPLPQSNFAGGLGALIDPNATATIKGTEQAIAALAARAAAAVGPVKGYAESLKQAEQAQRALVAIAKQVDAFQNQITVLRASRDEFTKARASVNALIDAMRTGTGGDDIAAKLSQAQSRLASATKEMSSQVKVARELKQELRAAGVSTNDLGGTQQRLTAAAQASTAATNTLTAAVRQFGTATQTSRREGEGMFNFLGRVTGERTTLSFFQRMRGEALGLATAFVGVQAAVNLAKGAIDVALANLRIMNGLAVVFNGNQARAREEFDYLRNTTRGLSVDFDTAAKGYAKFAIGAKSAGFTIQEIRFVFEKISLAARNAGLSNEEYEGTLKAIEQMMSKGVIQAEELKGQLGDRLPGAVSMLAQSMNKTVPELLKMMEQGGVVSAYVLNLAKQAGETFNVVNDSAAARLQASLNAQSNAMRDFKQALGDAGFIDAYTKFLNDLTTLLNSDEGQRLAKQLSGLFSDITIILGFMARNIEFVKGGLELMIGIGALAWLNKMALGFRTLVGVMGLTALSGSAVAGAITTAATAMGASTAVVGGLSTAVGVLGTALRFLARSIPFIGAALIAYDIGSSLYESWKSKRDKIKQEAADLKTEIDGKQGQTASVLGASSKFARLTDGKTPTSPDGIRFVDNDQQVATSIDAALKKNAPKLEKSDKAARLGGAKAELEERINIASEELNTLRKLAEEQIKDEKLKADKLLAIDKQLAQVRKIETQKYNNEHRRQGETDADRQLKLAMDLSQGLEKLADKNAAKEANIDPNATFADRLEARKKLAFDAYTEIADKITRLDSLLAKNPKAKAEVNKRLADAGIEGGLPGARAALDKQRQEAVDTAAKEAKQKELDRLEKKLSEAQGLLTTKLDAEQRIYEAGAQTQQELLANRATLTAKYNTEIDKSASAVEQFATTYRDLLDPVAYASLIARLQGLRASLTTGNRDDVQARLTAQEGATNRVLDERKRLLDEVAQKQQLGLIDSEAAASQVNAINARYKTDVLANTAATVTLIDTLRAMPGITPEAMATLDAMKAKMQGITLETSHTQAAVGGLENQIRTSVAGGISMGLNGMVDGVMKVATGVDKSRGLWTAFRNSAVGAIADVLKQIGMYIIQMQIANALAGSANPTLAGVGRQMGGVAEGVAGGAGGAEAGVALTAAATEAGVAITAAATEAGIATTTAATEFGTAVYGAATAFATAVEVAATKLAIQSSVSALHTGGVAGGPTGMSRSVSPGIFSTAARFHSGGVPGLSSGEVPAVLMKGEEVLTRNDPRHVLNGGRMGAAGSGQGGGGSQRFVLVDDRSKVHEAMATADGERVTIMNIKRNLPTIKAMLA